MNREEMAALEFCFDMFAKYQDLTQDQLAQVSLDSDESDILDKCYMVTQKIGMKKRSAAPKLPGGHGDDQWMSMFKKRAEQVEKQKVEMLKSLLLGGPQQPMI